MVITSLYIITWFVSWRRHSMSTARYELNIYVFFRLDFIFKGVIMSLWMSRNFPVLVRDLKLPSTLIFMFNSNTFFLWHINTVITTSFTDIRYVQFLPFSWIFSLHSDVLYITSSAVIALISWNIRTRCYTNRYEMCLIMVPTFIRILHSPLCYAAFARVSAWLRTLSSSLSLTPSGVRVNIFTGSKLFSLGSKLGCTFPLSVSALWRLNNHVPYLQFLALPRPNKTDINCS